MHDKHTLEFYPFEKIVICVAPMHMRTDGISLKGIWQCDCGYALCQDCFEIRATRMLITIVD